ncbi:hypothetical protein Cgig2_020087 [Carnegiea gigantea]|uniref:Ion transport domain-containing protein n=1 Tax=Carnegiea gigantea TaxID=171969 RepID=A0A9Q1QH37_9CARY|nr:hypothetical protein Cgig2_020087 [Carnegiea gigantea]
MKIKGSVMDPTGATAQWWNQIFLVAMMASLFIDPLVFFSLRVRAGSELCIETEVYLDVVFIILRSLNDLFYWAHIFLQFRMAYVAPSSRGFGRGKLVDHRMKIALRYLRKSFWMDLLAALPIPQVLVWEIIPNISASIIWDPKIALRFLILFQYFYRVYHIYLLNIQAMNATGAVSEKIWLRVVHNLLLFYVASHERQSCGYQLFDCSMTNLPSKSAWLTSSNVTTLCNPNNSSYQFGIYAVGITTGASSSTFLYKYSYALWLGLQSIWQLPPELKLHVQRYIQHKWLATRDNMKFIVLQFPTLRTTKLRHKFKFCSQQWQTWAACYIQAAWRCYRRRKEPVITSVSEYSSVDSADEEDHDMDIFVPRPDAGIEVYAARLITNIRREKSK